jgi:hypothetical protein
VSIIDLFFQGRGSLSPAGKRLLRELDRYTR